jgi:hypothetical protein
MAEAKAETPAVVPFGRKSIRAQNASSRMK